MENTKICCRCGRELPFSEFNKDKSRKDGLSNWCKDCYKQYKKERKEEIAEYFKQWYSTKFGYASKVRNTNLRNDRKYGRICINEDPLPTVEQYIELLSQPDHYDGNQYDFFEMGLDRIDNSKPHTLDNVVPCTTSHNKQRGLMTYEEYKNKLGVSPTS